MFVQIKRNCEVKNSSNLTPAQRKVLNDLKADDNIIICPPYKGKVMFVEDRDVYMAKSQDEFHEED